MLFDDYAYRSSVSRTMVNHAASLVARLIRERGLGPNSLALEIASNDGYLLRHYVDAGIPVLGIDPAANLAADAERLGVTTLVRYFGRDVAAELAETGRRADVVHAHNVLAHVPHINDVLEGIRLVLADDGVVVIETPYLRDLVEGLAFDTIYHEHLFYYSVTSLDRLLARNGLVTLRVEPIPIHGGSIRLIAGRDGQPDASVVRFLDDERAGRLNEPASLRSFAERVQDIREKVLAFLEQRRREGRHIAAYGAAAKGTVLLNACGVNETHLDFVADRNPDKQGRFMPGTRIPILPPEAIEERHPDDLLVLAWNVAAEIIEQESAFAQRGGSFLVALPEPRVVVPGDVLSAAGG